MKHCYPIILSEVFYIMLYIGIDPGNSGAFAILNGDDNSAEVLFWSQEEFIKKIKLLRSQNANCIACLESVHAMPSDSRKRAFAFGESLGFIQGVLQSFDIPYQLISPMKWKKEFNLIKQDKSQSILVCKQLYPTVSLKRTERCTKDSDGMAEALLMATYAKRKF